jgi:hypothetical protein
VDEPRPPGKVKAALFVDFDNIYTGLKKVHPKAADEFATNPARWLAWFEQGMPTRETEGEAARDRRALLLRLCYLNPVTFGKFRPYFTRSAFRVVDCPPLTQQNKNSTDIHMVMDILDALRHDTRFDEFILLSGDSDFTPVLLRLRLFDRGTVILMPGPVAQSYKAASDLVISEDVFIEEGLGLRPERVRRPPVAAPAAPPLAATPAPSPATTPAQPGAAAGALGKKILARVSELVAASPTPVTMAAAAADVIKSVGPEVLSTQWAGAGSFKELLRSAKTKSFQIATSTDSPGYLYDPARHSLQASAPPDSQEEWEGHPEELSAFAHRVSRVTGAPLLRPEEYALVFKALEDELKEEGYFLSSTSRAVRDRCALRGQPVSRKDVSFILKGVTYGGHEFGENSSDDNAETFAQVFRENVLKLCKNAQLELSDEEMKLLGQWIRA